MNIKIKHILEDLELEYPQSIRMVINYIKTLESYNNKLDKELVIKTQQYEYIRHQYPFDIIDKYKKFVDEIEIYLLELTKDSEFRVYANMFLSRFYDLKKEYVEKVCE